MFNKLNGFKNNNQTEVYVHKSCILRKKRIVCNSVFFPNKLLGACFAQKKGKTGWLRTLSWASGGSTSQFAAGVCTAYGPRVSNEDARLGSVSILFCSIEVSEVSEVSEVQINC